MTAPKPVAFASTNGSCFGFIQPTKEPNAVNKPQLAASGSRNPPCKVVGPSENALPIFYQLSAQVMKGIHTLSIHVFANSLLLLL